MEKLELFGIIILWVTMMISFLKMRGAVRYNRMLNGNDLLGQLARVNGERQVNVLRFTIIFVLSAVALIVYYI